MMGTVYLSSVYIIWKGAIYIDKGLLTIGGLIAVTDYLFQVSFMIISELFNIIKFVTGYISLKRSREIFENDIQDESNLQKIDKIESIEFKDVYFKYPNTKNYLLKNFNLKVEKNEKLAIIGKNASGKSTLIKLLLKFYEPEKGKILINNIDICKIETKSLREKFGVVPQKNEVFEGTLNNNITLEDKSISPEELNKIKKVASLQEFGESNRKILYKGNNISGGQKQRIAIARALIKKTDVLVLDEAYASLDINTQETIKNNILKDYNNTIIIDIGQKIEDRIIQKRIVEL